MNDIFMKDRMARNAVDYEGSGVGEGRYSATQERKEKFSETILPVVLFLFMGIYWVALIFISVSEVKHVFFGEKIVVETESYMDSVNIEPSNGKSYKVDISKELARKGSVTMYFYEKDESVCIPETWDLWLLFYGLGFAATFGLLYWIKTIWFNKKHAVKQVSEHNYKDY